MYHPHQLSVVAHILYVQGRLWARVLHLGARCSFLSVVSAMAVTFNLSGLDHGFCWPPIPDMQMHTHIHKWSCEQWINYKFWKKVTNKEHEVVLLTTTALPVVSLILYVYWLVNLTTTSVITHRCTLWATTSLDCCLPWRCGRDSYAFNLQLATWLINSRSSFRRLSLPVWGGQTLSISC